MRLGKIVSVLGILAVVVSAFFVKPGSVLAAGGLCCPEGYGTGIFNCPFGGYDPATQCCKVFVVTQYGFALKYPCDDLNPPPIPRCPVGWVDNNILECPLLTDLVNNCCKDGKTTPKILLAVDPTSSFCNSSDNTNPTVNTALGCVPVRVGPFATWLMGWVFGVAGGIAFLLMVYGFILLATTGDDPKKAQGAQETITSAITGLIVCIFAVFLLRMIAVNILRIPGIN